MTKNEPNKQMHVPCIHIPARKLDMHPITCKIFLPKLLIQPSSCFPYLSFVLFFLPFLSFSFLVQVLAFFTLLNLLGRWENNVYCFFDAFLSLMSPFSSFSLIFPIISLARKFVSLHLPFLLFSFIFIIKFQLMPPWIFQCLFQFP